MPFKDENRTHRDLTGLDRLWASIVRPLTFLGLLMGSLLGVTAIGMLGRYFFGPDTVFPTRGIVFLAVAIVVIIASFVVQHRSIHLSTDYELLAWLGL